MRQGNRSVREGTKRKEKSNIMKYKERDEEVRWRKKSKGGRREEKVRRY